MPFPLPPNSILYPHAVTIWRPTESINSGTGRPGTTTWAAVTTGQICYFQASPSNYSGTGGIVYNEVDIIWTLDGIRFPSSADVGLGDVVKQTTGPQVGRFWIIRGEPQYRTQFGLYLVVNGARLEDVPNGVS